VKSNTLPKDFCIAVVGHQGWSRDPDSTASYSLVVTFEILGQEIAIYEALRTAVIELQGLEAEIEDIEGEAEEEIEVDERSSSSTVDRRELFCCGTSVFRSFRS
jgi:hypothetical protein